MQIVEQTVTVGEGGRVAVCVAKPVGARVRVVVLDEANTAPDAQALTEEEQFQMAALAAVTEDDAEEDAIWERYLRG
jgi:hypothetical protein